MSWFTNDSEELENLLLALATTPGEKIRVKREMMAYRYTPYYGRSELKRRLLREWLPSQEEEHEVRTFTGIDWGSIIDGLEKKRQEKRMDEIYDMLKRQEGRLVRTHQSYDSESNQTNENPFIQPPIPKSDVANLYSQMRYWKEMAPRIYSMPAGRERTEYADKTLFRLVREANSLNEEYLVSWQRENKKVIEAFEKMPFTCFICGEKIPENEKNHVKTKHPYRW